MISVWEYGWCPIRSSVLPGRGLQATLDAPATWLRRLGLMHDGGSEEPLQIIA
jgi:hypothetical protein